MKVPFRRPPLFKSDRFKEREELIAWVNNHPDVMVISVVKAATLNGWWCFYYEK